MTETARGAALAALCKIETRGAYANLALAAILARSQLDQRERAFCTDLVNGTLRMRSRLDYLLSQLLVKPLADLPAAARNLLRLSVYQMEFHPNIAPYGIVDEAVSLIKRRGLSGFAGLINAVLRGFIRRRAELRLPGQEDPLAHLVVTLSHPAWLAERWLARLGPGEAFALAEAGNRPAPVTLRANTLRTDRASLRAQLAAAEVEAVETGLAPEGLRLRGARAIEDLPGYREGLFFVQDEGPMLAAHVLAPAAGERILDMCAAPGGKTTHLAALCGDRAAIVALDDHEHKARLIRENCRRLGIAGVEAVACDARRYRPETGFDAVLLDAPCTGTGVLRRRADLRWRRRPEDLAELAALQRELLAGAAVLLRPGGRLVYCTCSLEPEENEEQIRWFTGEFPDFRTVDMRPYLPEGAKGLAGDEPWLYLWPHRQETDGFFLCRLERS